MAFLSEIHYLNTVSQAVGVAEYVEISVAPEDMGRLADFTVATYQTDGTVREQFNLADFTGVLDPDTGWMIFQITTRVTDPDHVAGSNEAEAVAFLDAASSPSLQTFVDIGGGVSQIKAISGPAAGATSTNIPSASGQSIQFDVYGNRVDGDITQGSSVICLTAGTLVETVNGPVPIEDLEVDDLIVTFDSGPQPIRMIHQRTIAVAELARNRKLWPVCIQKGALGFGLPMRNLRVSPQHRMLYQHIRVPLMFGEEAVFVRAKSLAASFEEVYVDSSLEAVTYYHLVFDKHEVIYAEGAPTESFHPGPEGIAALDADAREELFTIFPHLRFGNSSHSAAYRTLRSWELMTVVA
ncbi:Hint domain-containing protein [Cognatiyoonia koreensis]|uniref:Hint domain-containing protein n=1 Tax=Cognatiyoonia koreensis TaxID=364200 RepID=A0A1I0QJK0_9RHOB|nr:Hint domain-containing protein [Cognatiyoonia koreensis]SEW27365.1 Hint domain-containing protein [Cognatiyoonia koreensis]